MDNKPILLLNLHPQNNRFIIMFGRIIDLSVKLIRKYLPDPFVFAIILTFIAFIAAIPVTDQSPLEILDHWGNGIWGLLGFSMQMALVLVCGSALADSSAVKNSLRKIAAFPSSPAAAIATVTFISSVACWINWGFGLIVGAILAKEIAKQVKGVDYRLLIASAYSGFVVWHAGLSASIPLAMATEGKSLVEVTRGVIEHAIPISETIFATYNVIIVFFVIVALTLVNTLMHPKADRVITVNPEIFKDEDYDSTSVNPDKLLPNDKLNNSCILGMLIAFMGLGYFVVNIFVNGKTLDLNSVILLFMFVGILFHRTPIRYVNAITKSASSCAGILLQFPFYAGIMGIMTGVSAQGVSLAGEISNACVAISNEYTFPVLTFFSAGIVNVFVPSGGGQWAVQAPIMLPAGVQLGVEPAITGMAIAWGDAWTNLIQPFWALPALAIAKLNAKDIMGYCLIDLVVVGLIIIIGFLVI